MHANISRLPYRVLLIGLALIASLGISLIISSIPSTSADQLERPVMAVPADFTDTLVTTVAGPTALAFTPDGRILVTTQGGTLRVYQNGNLLATPALNITARVCSDSERGLLGVAVDPAFATNSRIYLYYTFMKFGSCARNASNSPINRVARFTLPASNIVDPAGEVVIVDNIASPNGNHNAGDLQFDRDGLLYISAGDGGCQLTNTTACNGANQNARRQDILSGKILRVDTSGIPPASNPWFSMSGSRRCGDPAGSPAGSGPCRETFAWGLRNPFRIAFDPNAASTRFFINDVGQNVWEEIDQAQAGADYGWSVREGHCATGSTTNCGAPPAGMTNPIYDYGRSAGCASITGGAFVPNGLWPATYNGTYLFSDYVCGRIFTLRSNGSGGFTATDFATGLGSGSAVHLLFGPNGTGQALYYTTFASGGQVRRIAFTGSVSTPVNTPTRTPTSGPTSTPTRTPTSGPTSTPTRTPTPVTGASCQVSYTIASQWDIGFVTNIVIRNTGSAAISGWALAWTFPGNQTITNIWNATATPNSGAVTASNVGHNGSIPSNGTVDFGFQASYSGTNARPASFILNGVACAITP